MDFSRKIVDFAERYSFRLSSSNYGTVTLNSGRKPTWNFSVSGHVSFLTSNSLLFSLLYTFFNFRCNYFSFCGFTQFHESLQERVQLANETLGPIIEAIKEDFKRPPGVGDGKLINSCCDYDKSKLNFSSQFKTEVCMIINYGM